MEEQISSLFNTILESIKHHENNYKKSLDEKQQTINALNEFKQKQQEDMNEFLKVSFASRWKKKSEEYEKKNTYLQNKLDSLTRTNESLNSRLDKKTNTKSIYTQTEEYKSDNCNSISTQTNSSDIFISTHKGGRYRLSNNKLYSLKDDSEKIIGYVE